MADTDVDLAALDAEVNRVVRGLERGGWRAPEPMADDECACGAPAEYCMPAPPASPRSTMGPFTAPPDVRIGQELHVNGCPARVVRLRYVRGEWQAWVDVEGAPGAPWEVVW